MPNSNNSNALFLDATSRLLQRWHWRVEKSTSRLGHDSLRVTQLLCLHHQNETGQILHVLRFSLLLFLFFFFFSFLFFPFSLSSPKTRLFTCP